MLKIGDLKVGDELECIDKDYAFKNLGNKIDPKLIVSHVCDDVFSIGSCLFNYSDIKYFKKKEKSQYTFDDLIDVAVQAYKDGVLSGLSLDNINSTCVRRLSFSVGGVSDQDCVIGDQGDDYKEMIYTIKSLYKETFVIECEDDVYKIKNGESVLILKNGKAFKFSELMDIPPSLLPDIIFGATVEQSK